MTEIHTVGQASINNLSEIHTVAPKFNAVLCLDFIHQAYISGELSNVSVLSLPASGLPYRIDQEMGLNRVSDFYSKIVILVHKSSKGRVFEKGKHEGRKRGEKKERRKHRKGNSEERSRVGDKFHREDKRFLPKERGEEDEKSDLTEEDKQPLSSQSLCYLSDGGKTHADSVPQKNKIVETSLRSYDKETRTAESLYQDLIANLEESFQFELNNLVDQEWLFGTTKQDRHGYKRLKVCHDVSCHADSTTRLRAQYLPEADVYGLPYTIPF
ncbi:hypothetical protein NC653_015093 [Populus alba x Populus x berolinensis]|uniref:Uncharacterized protein n=1 Tax=Populus alba x Populus x berolinensis TaxID=444605 RepID=A0AAD6W4R2_9ROSI|nr:hypothetical protein NC653_015093 [Populus alba x Populus x berolinensis]